MTRPEIPEGTFTGTGLDLLVGGFEPRPASDHVASNHVETERPSRWRRVGAWLGLVDD